MPVNPIPDSLPKGGGSVAGNRNHSRYFNQNELDFKEFGTQKILEGLEEQISGQAYRNDSQTGPLNGPGGAATQASIQR